VIEAQDMSTASASDRLHVALIGEQKSGKSRLFATAPGIKLDLDFDQRKEALAGIKDVYAITLRDPQFPRTPEALEDTLDIISGLEASLDLSELKDKLGKKIFSEAKPKTLVSSIGFDSIQSMAKSAAQYEMSNNRDLRREINIGTGQRALSIYIQKSYDAWNAEMKTVESIIMRAFALPINVFCMFHEAAEETPDSTEEDRKYTGRVTVYPVRYRNILQYFNEVWRVRLAPSLVGQQQMYLPRVYPLPDYSLNAATTMLLDSLEEPDIMKMIAKHKARVSSGWKRDGAAAPIGKIAGVSS